MRLPRLKGILSGRPLATHQERQERLSKAQGLAIFSSDNISSSAYATEEILRILVLAGVGALVFALPISLVVVLVLAIVVFSYHQTIRAYPGGGGSYIVSKDNLGIRPALVAAAALLTDYVLTVSVSVAAGIGAVTSLLPGLYPYRVPVGLAVIALLTVGNLRGIRQSGNLFAAPTYFYVVSMYGLLAYGLFRYVTGTFPAYTPPPDAIPSAAIGLTPFLLLRAFASGAVALTGVEAVSDGVAAFKPPESRNARMVLTTMAVLFATIFLGVSLFAGRAGLVPDPTEQETIVSQFARLLAGPGWFHLLIQCSTALILFMAANTSFADFPRLSSILARDRFLPHQFAFRGIRLAFSTGIIALAVTAGLLLAVFRGSVAALIPLYTVGVFVAFTLSQAGMVRYWWRSRDPGWRRATVINGIGAVATGVVAIEVGSAKFVQGAWMALVLMLLLVLLMRAIRNHYTVVAEELSLQQPVPVVPRSKNVVILVSGVHQATLKAVQVARIVQASSVRGVHVATDPAEGEEVRRKWNHYVPDIRLDVVPSPYRELIEPLIQYLDNIKSERPGETTIVVLPEFIPTRLWHHFLHRQTALQIRWALEHREDVEILDVPYRLRGKAGAQ